MKEFGVRCSSGEHSKSEEAGAKNLRTLAQLCSGKADEIGTRSQPLLGAIKGACQFPTDQIISSCSSQAGLADLWGFGKGRRGSMALIHLPHPLCPSSALSHIHHSCLAVVPNSVWQENGCIHWDLSEWS